MSLACSLRLAHATVVADIDVLIFLTLTDDIAYLAVLIHLGACLRALGNDIALVYGIAELLGSLAGSQSCRLQKLLGLGLSLAGDGRNLYLLILFLALADYNGYHAALVNLLACRRRSGDNLSCRHILAGYLGNIHRQSQRLQRALGLCLAVPLHIGHFYLFPVAAYVYNNCGIRIHLRTSFLALADDLARVILIGRLGLAKLDTQAQLVQLILCLGIA